MTKDQIKKEITNQNSEADFNYEIDGFKNYSTQIIIDGIEEIIEFRVPIKQCVFNETVPAELLTEWLVK
jgi:hypothetical protein